MSPEAMSYIETNALLAVMEGDTEEAIRLVESLLPNERAELADQVSTLLGYLSSVCKGCGKVIRSQGDLVVVGLIGREQYHRACQPEQS